MTYWSAAGSNKSRAFGFTQFSYTLSSQNNHYDASEVLADSDNEDIDNQKTKKRTLDYDDDDDDIPIGSAHKKHRVQNFENFLDDEADDDDEEDANISLGKSMKYFSQQTLSFYISSERFSVQRAILTRTRFFC